MIWCWWPERSRLCELLNSATSVQLSSSPYFSRPFIFSRLKTFHAAKLYYSISIVTLSVPPSLKLLSMVVFAEWPGVVVTLDKCLIWMSSKCQKSNHMTHMIYHISYMEILIKLICCFDLSFLSFCLFEFFVNFVVNLFLELFSSCFDTSGSMIPLLVSEIPLFVTLFVTCTSAVQQELGILVVGLDVRKSIYNI